MLRHADRIINAVEECPPTRADELAAAALALHVRRNLDAADEYADRAVKADDGSSLSYLARGILRRKKKDASGAEADLRRAVELDPTALAAHLELGLALGARGDLTGSRAAFAQAIELEPDYIVAHFSLAISYFEAGQRELATPSCEAVLKHQYDSDMAVCRGLSRFRAGEHAGAVDDLAGTSGDWAGENEAEINKALRDAHLALKDPLAAAEYVCIDGIDGYGIDAPDCGDTEAIAALAAFRSNARDRATEGSFADTRALTTRAFSKQIALQANDATDLEAFIHPDIGVFVFTPNGWDLSRESSWPAIGEAEPPLRLKNLRQARRLPKSVKTETDERDCGYPLNGLGAPGEPSGLPEFYNAGVSGVYDDYRYGSYADDETILSKTELVLMQRAALAITHHIVFSREIYEFGKIGDRWYLLTVSVYYDPEDDACG